MKSSFLVLVSTVIITSLLTLPLSHWVAHNVDFVPDLKQFHQNVNQEQSISIGAILFTSPTHPRKGTHVILFHTFMEVSVIDGFWFNLDQCMASYVNIV